MTLSSFHFIVEMGPNPTRAHIWPAVNKMLTQLRPGYFPTRPKAIFFDPKRKKLKNLTFLGDIFEIQTQTINGWPYLGQKFLTRTHHYFIVININISFKIFYDQHNDLLKFTKPKLIKIYDDLLSLL